MFGNVTFKQCPANNMVLTNDKKIDQKHVENTMQHEKFKTVIASSYLSMAHLTDVEKKKEWKLWKKSMN